MFLLSKRAARMLPMDDNTSSSVLLDLRIEPSISILSQISSREFVPFFFAPNCAAIFSLNGVLARLHP